MQQSWKKVSSSAAVAGLALVLQGCSAMTAEPVVPLTQMRKCCDLGPMINISDYFEKFSFLKTDKYTGMITKLIVSDIMVSKEILIAGMVLVFLPLFIALALTISCCQGVVSYYHTGKTLDIRRRLKSGSDSYDIPTTAMLPKFLAPKGADLKSMTEMASQSPEVLERKLMSSSAKLMNTLSGKPKGTSSPSGIKGIHSPDCDISLSSKSNDEPVRGESKRLTKARESASKMKKAKREGDEFGLGEEIHKSSKENRSKTSKLPSDLLKIAKQEAALAQQNMRDDVSLATLGDTRADATPSGKPKSRH